VTFLSKDLTVSESTVILPRISSESTVTFSRTSSMNLVQAMVAYSDMAAGVMLFFHVENSLGLQTLSWRA
jgi:hypothetical protein